MKTRIWPALLIITVCLATGLGSRVSAGTLKQDVKEATGKFQDITATIVNTYVNQKNLSKMGKSFSRAHEFKKATVKFKDPDKFRMDGVVGLVRIQYIQCGNTRVIRVPGLHYSKREDMADEPGKQQSCLDVGIVTDGLWTDYNVRQLGSEKTDSGETIALQLARIGDNRWNEKIWVDGKTFKLLKKETFTNEGDLKARYIFKDHKLIDGVIWAPTKTETHDHNGQLAAISEMRSVKVNTGIRDSEFK